MENNIVRMLFLRRQRQKKRWKIKTISGAPPLSFKAKAGALKDYRIYGNTVDGESVGDLETTGEHAGEYKVPVTVEGKNLLKNTATSQTINGVTFTVNSDGSVTCNGTASMTTFLTYSSNITISERAVLTGCPNDGGAFNYLIKIQKHSTSDTITNDTGVGSSEFYYADPIDVVIRIAFGYTCNNLTFYPMVRKADIEDDTYEPYRAPVTTPIYLPEQIRKVGDEAEYIDYGEQKLHRVRKNLLPNNGTSYTTTIITATKNDDGSITISNHGEKRTQVTWTYYNSDDVLFKAGTQIIISTRYETGISFKYSDNTWSGLISQNQVYTIPKDVIRAYSQFYINGDEIHTLYPMIRKADIEDDTYEPYIENTEVDVILPALPTLEGTNVLTVGTAVQPSDVYIKGKIKKGE